MEIETPNKGSHGNHLEKYNVNVKTAFFTIMLSIFVDVLGYSMILPLLPQIAKIYGAEDIIVGVLISSNAFTALIFGPIWGKLSDIYGRKPILIISQAGTFAAFLILGISDSIGIIFLSRIVDGIFGGQIPIIRAYITDITTPETRSSEIGKITVSFSLGMVLGPSLGGFLGAISWRYPAFLACGMAIISIILTFKVLIESMPRERRDDLREEMIKKYKLSGKRSIWNKGLIMRLLQLFMAFSITLLFNSSFPLVMFKRYGADSIAIGLVMTVGALVVMFYGGFLMKRLIRKFGERNIFLFTISLAIGISLFYPFLFEFWMVFVFVIPFGLVMAFLPGLIQSNMTKAVESNKQGVASGYSTNFQSIAQSIMPLVSTGYLQIGMLSLGFLYLNAYDMIGFTAAMVAIILLFLVIVDLKWHPKLYAHEKREEIKQSKTA
ncbi:MAG: MFS transporter [Candidatus Lokiarchaeota archaeon]|nr:MFS transporter [Candidatus Lokiarchaeota archaeon]MBD3201486.1 MFS transporter [Candidatus Lokiarchaeota archaeon]